MKCLGYNTLQYRDEKYIFASFAPVENIYRIMGKIVKDPLMDKDEDAAPLVLTDGYGGFICFNVKLIPQDLEKRLVDDFMVINSLGSKVN